MRQPVDLILGEWHQYLQPAMKICSKWSGAACADLVRVSPARCPAGHVLPPQCLFTIPTSPWWTHSKKYFRHQINTQITRFFVAQKSLCISRQPSSKDISSKLTGSTASPISYSHRNLCTIYKATQLCGVRVSDAIILEPRSRLKKSENTNANHVPNVKCQIHRENMILWTGPKLKIVLCAYTYISIIMIICNTRYTWYN